MIAVRILASTTLRYELLFSAAYRQRELIPGAQKLPLRAVLYSGHSAFFFMYLFFK